MANIADTEVRKYRLYGLGHAKTSLTPYANNKGADQPAHCCSLLRPYDMYTCCIQSFEIIACFCS